MILTEEQRAAIKLAMKYIARWPFAYKELHARGVLQAMIDSSEHIREPPKMVGFDLAARIRELEAENERLRASLIDLHAEYINTLEKNPECSAWDLDEQSDADQKRLRRNAAHAISIVEPPIYLQAEQRATKIKALEDALVEERVIGEGGFRAGQCEFWYIEDLPEESCMELDGLCDWAKCPRKHELCDVAYQQLAEEGKIGPDADAKPHCWQITEERKAAIKELSELLTAIGCPSCHYYIQKNYGENITVLRAMLTEVGQE